MRILIADDHDLVRDSIACLITRKNPDYSVKTTGTLDDALEMSCQETVPFDLIVLDLNMPGMNGFQGLQRIIAASTDSIVAIISGETSRRVAKEALSKGAKGFIPKTISAKAIISALDLIASGETYFPVSLADAEDETEDRSPTATEKYRLTARESDVLERLVECRSNKEIARDLDIQEITVKLHVRSILRKFGARNRTEVVKQALSLSSTEAA